MGLLDFAKGEGSLECFTSLSGSLTGHGQDAMAMLGVEEAGGEVPAGVIPNFELQAGVIPTLDGIGPAPAGMKLGLNVGLAQEAAPSAVDQAGPDTPRSGALQQKLLGLQLQSEQKAKPKAGSDLSKKRTPIVFGAAAVSLAGEAHGDMRRRRW